jgi:hypothetical protein
VDQDDGQASMPLIAKTSSGCRGYFDLVGTTRKVATYEDCS